MAKLKLEGGAPAAPPAPPKAVWICGECGCACHAPRLLCPVCELRAQATAPEPPTAPPPAPRVSAPRPPRPAVLPLAEQLTEAEEAAGTQAPAPQEWPAVPPFDVERTMAACSARRTGERKLISVTTALTPEVRLALEARATARGLKLGVLVREIIEQWVQTP